jgi:uncharacterized protein (TIGR03435 family)
VSRIRRVSCAVALSLGMAASTALAQGSPAFEVASVRPSPDTPPAAGVAGVHITKQQVRFAYLSLRDYLSIAYKLPVHQISGPEWINSTRFDVAATLPPGTTPDDFPQLVLSLLRDRFKLQAHRESRESPVYTLEVGRNGSKLVAVPDDTRADAPVEVTSSGGPDGVAADLGNGSSFSLTNTRFEFKKVTMATFVDTLGRFMDHPVLDRTKLEGRYDVVFNIAAEDYMPLLIRSAVNAGISLPSQALQVLDNPSRGSLEAGLKALGLSLEQRRAPLDHLVVDSIERTPTEN